MSVDSADGPMGRSDGHSEQTPQASGELLTERLQLMPTGPEHVDDLVVIHRDPWIAEWYAGKWRVCEAEGFAQASARAWEMNGVAKWIAYDRGTGALAGRGGLSCMASDGTSAQIASLVGPRCAPQRLELGRERRFGARAMRRRSASLDSGLNSMSFGRTQSFRSQSVTTCRPAL